MKKEVKKPIPLHNVHNLLLQGVQCRDIFCTKTVLFMPIARFVKKKYSVGHQEGDPQSVQYSVPFQNHSYFSFCPSCSRLPPGMFVRSFFSLRLITLSSLTAPLQLLAALRHCTPHARHTFFFLTWFKMLVPKTQNLRVVWNALNYANNNIPNGPQPGAGPPVSHSWSTVLPTTDPKWEEENGSTTAQMAVIPPFTSGERFAT
jgi:hypothetical protein